MHAFYTLFTTIYVNAGPNLFMTESSLHAVSYSNSILSTFTRQQQQRRQHKSSLVDICGVHLPVVVSADSPHADATDWLRVEQAAIIWVNQGQHAILKH